MRRIILLAVMLFTVSAALIAHAQDSGVPVSLRANVQDGFIRLVFTGAALPTAVVTETGKDSVQIAFEKTVTISGADAAVAGLKPATSIDAAGKNVTVKTGALTRHRTLALGNRLFVDLFTSDAPAQDNAAKADAPKAEEKAAETPKPVEEPAPAPSASLIDDKTKPAEAPKEAAKEEAKTEEPKTEVAKEIAALRAPPAETVVPAAETAPTPVVTPSDSGKVFTGAAIITIGSTQGVALAAFTRAGYLWMVLSQEQLSVPPQISGPDAAMLGPIDNVKIDGGSAYRIKLPEGAYVRPEGAGLVWRLYITGQKTNLGSVAADRDFSDTAAGPQVRIPLPNAISALRLPDPVIGDDLAVVTVGRAENRLINSDSYVDFDLLPAIVGAVIRPKADGIRIAVQPTEVVIARQGGLRMSATGPRAAPKVKVAAEGENAATPAPVKAVEPTKILALKDWALGGPKEYLDMRRSIDSKIASAPEDRKLPELISGAKFMLAQGLPQEATGYLQMALAYMPSLRDSAEFQAIYGAVAALKGDADDAAKAFAAPGLENIDEMGLWRAYTTARTGNLPEAQKLIPANGQAILASYPARMQALMLPPLIEAVLARGDVNVAETMVGMYDKASESTVDLDRDSAVSYFHGRIEQLRGNSDGSSIFFRDAAEGLSGPYPVRATLALVERGLSARTIDRPEAVRKLERFRYGWRGDNLESETLERLGLIYVTGGEQRRGLTILRDAATQTQDPAERDKLVSVMQKAFRELFSGKTKEKMSPIDAASVAAEFAELMPAGGEGESITMTIADKMVAVDLLDRAAGMIEPMISSTATAADALRYAERAATIRLLNDQPSEALKALDNALTRSDIQGKTIPSADVKRIGLLRAKAKGELKRTDDALAELAALPEDSETWRLTADIAWGAQRWPEAAAAFDKLVKASNLSATKPATHEQAQLVLNEALALNLSGETDKLEELRVSYSDIMRRTDLNQPFQVVTRSAQNATLADRETLLKLVSEVNMFKDVLESYRTEPETPAKTPAKEPAKAPEKAAAPTGQTDQKPAEKPESDKKSN